MNIARNLGGSIGISAANVVLAQRTQFHQSRLAENTVPSSPAFQSTLSQMTKYFMAHGAAAGDANGQAMGMIGQMVRTQATILAGSGAARAHSRARGGRSLICRTLL
jgi:DHA2 family multidrug resistance protein